MPQIRNIFSNFGAIICKGRRNRDRKQWTRVQ